MRDCDPAASWAGRPAILIGLVMGFAALLAARDPSIVLHAGFWAEDGWVWYPEAYQYGAGSLLRPLAGYLQTVSRLVGLAAQPFPLAWAPTIFAATSLVIQTLPPVFLVSSRMDRAFPDARARLLFAIVWLALPNTREVYVNLTNAQWHLAALAFLVLVSRPPVTRRGWAFDAVTLVLSGLSGPFCGVLVPVAAWLAWSRRDAASLWRMAAVLSTAAVQAGFVATTIGERSHAPLGADALLLTRIVMQQVVFGALLGQEGMAALLQMPAWQDNIVLVAAALVVAALTATALAHGSALLRLTVLATALLFAAAMLRPQISGEGPQWPPMQTPGVGQRYYYLPMTAWLAVMFALAGGTARWRRAAGAVLLAVFGFGVWCDWNVPPRAPSDFKAQVRAFRAAPPGTWVYFTFPPSFADHPMVLVKR